MRNKLFIGILFIALAGVLIVPYTGCESKKGSIEVIGFPQSFADLAETPVGKIVDVSVIRKGKELSLKIKVEEQTSYGS